MTSAQKLMSGLFTTSLINTSVFLHTGYTTKVAIYSFASNYENAHKAADTTLSRYNPSRG